MSEPERRDDLRVKDKGKVVLNKVISVFYLYIACRIEMGGNNNNGIDNNGCKGYFLSTACL